MKVSKLMKKWKSLRAEIIRNTIIYSKKQLSTLIGSIVFWDKKDQEFKISSQDPNWKSIIKEGGYPIGLIKKEHFENEKVSKAIEETLIPTKTKLKGGKFLSQTFILEKNTTPKISGYEILKEKEPATAILSSQKIWKIIEDFEVLDSYSLKEKYGDYDYSEDVRVEILEELADTLSERANEIIFADDRLINDMIMDAHIVGVRNRVDFLNYIDPYGILPLKTENKEYKKNMGKHYLHKRWKDANKLERELAFNQFLEEKLRTNIRNLRNKVASLRQRSLIYGEKIPKMEKEEKARYKGRLKRLSELLKNYYPILKNKRKKLKRIKKRVDSGWRKLIQMKDRNKIKDLNFSKLFLLNE
jgi:hypothetical protein